MKHRSLMQTVSCVRRGLRLVGIPIPTGHGTLVANEAWQAYLASVPDRPDDMPKFAGWNSAAGRDPGNFTSEVIAEWYNEQCKRRPVESVKKSVRRIVACLNAHPPRR